MIYGEVAGGKTRVCILAFGESGLSGRDPNLATLPVGYPPLDNTLFLCADPYGPTYRRNPWKALSEPTDVVQNFIQDAALKETTTVGAGWGGLFCWKLRVHLGANYEVGLIQCAKGSSTLANWAVGGAHYNQTVARANAALAVAGCTLGGILLDLGLNDALASSSPPWSTAALPIVDGLRGAITGAASTPVLYRKSQSQTAYPGLVSLRTQQDAWEDFVSPRRIKLTYDSTVNYVDADHLNNVGNNDLADVAIAEYIARVLSS